MEIQIMAVTLAKVGAISGSPVGATVSPLMLA